MNGAQIDERLDLLNDLRRAGYAEHDIKLTDSGHDFVVCLDAMRRLRAELTLDGIPEAPAPPPVLHAPELEAAMKAAPDPEHLPVCPTALQGLKREVVDRCLLAISDPKEREVVRRDLLRAGTPPTDALVEAAHTRGVLNGMLAYGVSIGLGIARLQSGGAS